MSEELLEAYKEASEEGSSELFDIGDVYGEDVGPDSLEVVAEDDVPLALMDDASHVGLTCVNPRLKDFVEDSFTVTMMCKGPNPGDPWETIEVDFTYDEETGDLLLDRVSARVVKNPVTHIEKRL
mgnify:CR=1 FL=1